MRASQRGQAMVGFALLLPLVLLPVAAYAVEATMLSAREAHLQEVAAQAAEDAAQQLSVPLLRAGTGFSLDRNAAVAAVRALVASVEPGASIDSVSVAGNVVNVTLSERLPLRLATFVPGAAANLRATASARLTPGFDTPGG